MNPLYLEIGERPPVSGDERQRAYVRAMDAFSEYWYFDSRGNRTEYDMKALEKRAIETARAYCDVCLESDAQDWKRRGNWDKCVEKIEDIMG